MTSSQPHIQAKTVIEWLAYIEALHPKSIAMGLDRVKLVLKQLQLCPKFPIITVAGTNGKGSVCAMLSHIYVEAGYQVGCYTSPHIQRYNERVTVNLQPITDDDLCSAFAAVEAARCTYQNNNSENGAVALTYFEMGTLAAMWHFCHQPLDVCILEIGLGGRLDAVNVFEPNCAIVTTIALDHMEFLGDTREQIGFEKAGVFRANKPAICGDENPPNSLVEYAKKIGADLQLIQRDFHVKKTSRGWQYSDRNMKLDLPILGLIGDFQLNNAACVVRAVLHLNNILPVITPEHSSASPQPQGLSPQNIPAEAGYSYVKGNTPGQPLSSAKSALDSPCIHAAFSAMQLTGRFQYLQSNPQIIVDVAHNPHAAKSLMQNLKSMPCAGKTLAVFGMLADKDIAGVIASVQAEIDAWYLADIDNARGAKAQDLQQYLLKAGNKQPIRKFADVAAALAAACIDAHKSDRIIVFGSFYTVADAMAANRGNANSRRL